LKQYVVEYGGSAVDIRRNLKKGLKRSVHAAKRATATASLKRLEDKLDPDLAGEIAAAIERRDALAHRFLRERFRGDTVGGRFIDGSVQALVDMADEFRGLATRSEAVIVELEERALRDFDADPEIVEAFERIGRMLLRDEPSL
jgi:hypothetical protein